MEECVFCDNKTSISCSICDDFVCKSCRQKCKVCKEYFCENCGDFENNICENCANDAENDEEDE